MSRTSLQNRTFHSATFSPREEEDVTVISFFNFFQKSIVMRIRIAYKMNNKDVLEEGQINNFPRGL